MRLLFLLLLTGFSCLAQGIILHPYPADKQDNIVPYIPAGEVIKVSDIYYCDTIKLDVYSPQTPVNAAALLLIHGGGWTTGDRRQLAQMANRMAESGYVCFVPQYRLSGQAKYPAAAQDIQSALNWITENAGHYNIRPEKIIAAGFSAGGHLAALLGTTYHKSLYRNGLCTSQTHGKPAAIIDIDGILAFIHPESGEGNDGKKLSSATQWFGYPKSSGTAGWEEASPLNHVSSQTPPTLFINSSVKRMHAGREDFNAILQKNGVYHEVHEFENAPHDFCVRTPWFSATIEIMDSFIRKL